MVRRPRTNLSSEEANVARDVDTSRPCPAGQARPSAEYEEEEATVSQASGGGEGARSAVATEGLQRTRREDFCALVSLAQGHTQHQMRICTQMMVSTAIPKYPHVSEKKIKMQNESLASSTATPVKNITTISYFLIFTDTNLSIIRYWFACILACRQCG